MAQLTSIGFPATAESVVTWSRQLTAQELADLQAKKGAMVAAGKFGNFPAPVEGTSIYSWTTTDVANEWVAFCNTFSPPPTTATVNAITDPA